MADHFSITDFLPGSTPVMQAFLACQDLAALTTNGGEMAIGANMALEAWADRLLSSEARDTLDVVLQVAVLHERFRPDDPADFDVEGFLDAFRSIAEGAIGFLNV